MALYIYEAFSREGKKEKGQVDASSVQAVKDILAGRSLFPISIALADGATNTSWWKQFTAKGVPTKEKILFTRQLAVLLRAGVPLLQALELLAEQFTGSARDMLIEVKDEIKEGGALADALKKYPKTFDNIYIQLVRAGEASGKLELILERLVTLLERQEVLAKRVRGALMMPIIQLVFSFIVVVILITQVVPTIAGPLREQGKELPLPTKILIGIGDFLTTYYLIIGVVVGALVGAFVYWKSTPSGAYTLDKIKLKLPIIGYFAQMNAIIQFCQTLGMLTEGGVNFAQSLDIVCAIISNKVLARELSAARDKIIKEGRIAQYLKQTNIFPPMAIYLISTGEQSGALDTMLLTIAKNYEEELGEYADNLSALIGPVILVVMAVIVGFIVLSVALPMVEMTNIEI